MSQERKDRPAIAGADVDTESGTEGAVETDKAIFALKVMRDRGLISKADYERRRAALGSKAKA